MNDELQRIWRSQGEVTLDPTALAETLRRHDQTFGRMISLRDMREIGVSLVLIPIWIGMGLFMPNPSPWTWWLAIPALIWVAGFMFVDRRRQQRAAPAAGASLRNGLDYSLSQVEHQIWLLRNIAWWYLLPLGIPIALFFVQVTVQAADRSHTPLWQALLGAAGPVGTLIGVYGFIYWLNQYAVRKQLEPLRERLESALAALGEDEPAAMPFADDEWKQGTADQRHNEC
jgi:hypothetical protein